MLLGEQTGERLFQCRIKDVAQAEWTVSFPESRFPQTPDVAVSGYVIGQGVDSIQLGADDLPWSPGPYEALIELRLREDGELRTWRVIVVPHPADSFPDGADATGVAG